MNKFLLAVVAILGLGINAYSQYCPSCIQNSATPQVAQFNVSSATVRGQLTIGQISISTLTASTITAGNFIGSGTYLTNLNASQLGYGTVPSARVSGAYPGITSIGPIASGTWNGSIIGSQYGGTGANLVTSNPGSLPYFSSVGTMSALAPATAGFILQTNGSLAPSWTGAPQVLGTNVTGIPMANLIPGTLPTTIGVSDASLSTVSASKVIGNIPGNATNITGTLPLGQLGAGTLNTSNPASSVTASGVTPGIWGGPNNLPQITVAYDGRITAISQSSFSVTFSSSMTGPLPLGVTVQPSQISSGTFGGSVVASSIAATSVTPGSYGTVSKSARLTVAQDGRLSFANEMPIAIDPSQINAGTFPSGVLLPAANVQSGSLGGGVIASSLTASGVVAGTYGNATHAVTITVGQDGRVSSLTSFPIPGATTTTVQTDVDNGWTATQTFFSSITVHGKVGGDNFIGDGFGLTSIQPGNISAGTLLGNVVASSLAVNSVVPSVVSPGFYGNITISSSQVAGISSATVAAAGTDGQLQYNNSGALGATSELNWVSSDDSLVLGSTQGIVELMGAMPGIFVSGDDNSPGNIPSSFEAVVYSTNATPSFGGAFSRGSIASPLSAQSGDWLSLFGASGFNGSNWNDGSFSGFFSFYAAENFTPTKNGTGLNLELVKPGTTNYYSTVFTAIIDSATSNGMLGINNHTPSYPLDVNGDANVSGTLTASSSTITHLNGSTITAYVALEAALVQASTIQASAAQIATINFVTQIGSLPTIDQVIVAASPTTMQWKTIDTIRGPLTVTSTEAVQGNAFSVGGSSFSVSGGSATVAYRMTAGSFSGNGAALTSLTAANISAGSLGASVIASSLSVNSVVPSNVSAGTYNNISIPAANVNAGTLGASVIASSVSASGVASGTYGNSSNVPQITIGVDGRISSAVNVAIPGISTNTAQNNIDNGWTAPQTFFSSVTVVSSFSAVNISGNGSGITSLTTGNLSAGVLPSNVIASSVAASGVASGTYGSATQTSQVTVGVDGRITSALNVTITGVPAATVPASGVQAGSLGASVIASSVAVGSVLDSAIVSVSGSKVTGNISGNAANITGNLAASQVAAGSLGASVIASSIAANGVSAGTYGSATQVSQVVIGGDGRVTSASNVTITGVPAATVPASGVQSGTLGATVVASSVAASGITAATYGSATQAPQIVFGVDGRATSASNVTVTPAAASITSGTLGAAVIASSVAATGVSVGSFGSSTQAGAFTVGVDGRLSAASNVTVTPAAGSITAGTLGASVIASSVAASGVASGTYGSSTQVSQITVGVDGRISSASNVTITGASPSGAAGGVLAGNYPTPLFGSQVVLSSNIANGAVTDSQTSLSTGAINSGKFGDNRVAISTAGVTSGKFGDSQLAFSTAALTSGKWGDSQVSITTGALSGIVQVVNGGTGSGTASGARLNLSAAQSSSNADIVSMSSITTITSAVTVTSSFTNVSPGGTAITYGLTVGSVTVTNSEIVESTLTVIGNAFSVGGSTFTISGGSATVAYSLTAGSGNVVLNGFSTSTYTNGISASSITASGFYLTNITQSSCTVIPNNTFTNTAFGVALATVTLVSRGFDINISLLATLSNNNAGGTTSCTALVDSVLAESTKALVSQRVPVANGDTNGFFLYRHSGVAAGSHTYALACNVTSNTGALLNDSTHYTQFCATERP